MDHLARIVDELLDVTRVSTGKIQLDCRVTDLGTLLRAALEDHRLQFEKKGIAIEGRIAAGVWVEGDATRLAQVFGNLFVNAMKFTPPGGHVEVELRADEGRAVVSVRDDGIGMAPELCERIFAPFFQGPQALDRTLGGLGLGLAAVKGLVELHGGTVNATSRGVGSGSCFEIRLPVVQAPQAAVEPPPPPRSSEGRRVLVVEDDVEIADAMGDAVTMAGHDARVEHDGPSALAQAHAFRPEIVFCDIGLPDMNGYEVARRMRADEAVRGACLVALSGYARAEDRKRSAEAGFDCHVAKPASWGTIERLIAELPPRAARAGR